MIFRRLVTFCIGISLFLSAGTARADDPITYVVQPGENLFRIGLRFGLTAQQIATANNLADVSQIYAGQRLVIPAAGAANAPAYSPAATEQVYYVVQSGENLFRIALRYGMSVQALATANHLVNVSQVYAGQRLLIPSSVSAPLPSVAKSALLPVPVLAQGHSLTCEAAAARMVAVYLGKPASEAWIQGQLGLDDNPHVGFRGNIDAEFGGITNYGVYAEPLARVLQSLGLGAIVRYNIGYADVRAALDNGHPVIVWLSQFAAPGYYDQPGGYRLVPGEHTYVVVGYDDSGLVVNDPLNGGRQFHIRAIPHWELFNNMALIAGKS